MLINEIMTKNTGSMPVVNAAGVATGMITDRDICMAGYTQGRLLSEIPVSAVMSTELYAVTPDSEVKAAEQLMRDKQVRRLPVIDEGGKPVGVVSLHDLAQRLGRGKSSLDAREIAETLRDVSKPRAQGPTLPPAVQG